MLGPFLGYCWDRADGVLARTVEGPWNVGLEQPPSVELMNFCMTFEDDVESSADSRGSWVSEGSWGVHRRVSVLFQS